jgi:hypothetical protein
VRDASFDSIQAALHRKSLIALGCRHFPAFCGGTLLKTARPSRSQGGLRAASLRALRHQQSVGNVVGERRLLAGNLDGNRPGFRPVGDDRPHGIEFETRLGEIPQELW